MDFSGEFSGLIFGNPGIFFLIHPLVRMITNLSGLFVMAFKDPAVLLVVCIAPNIHLSFMFLCIHPVVDHGTK